MAAEISSERKPRVVALGKPEFISDEYIEDFKKDFDYDVSQNKPHEFSTRSYLSSKLIS
jgi:hypothetical protein